MTLQSLTFSYSYKSGLEERVGKQLEELGVEFSYESVKLDYRVPSRPAKYTPDFLIGHLVIECKGWFKTKERQKMLQVRKDNPDLDIRLVFERAKNRIYKGSPTTYGAWATKNGFKWADRGIIPDEWIKEVLDAT